MSTISWEPRYDAGDGTLRSGGWTWRYDLTPTGPSKTTVTLSYDWSAVPDSIREHIGFPPFPPEHLGNSLAHRPSPRVARVLHLPCLNTHQPPERRTVPSHFASGPA